MKRITLSLILCLLTLVSQAAIIYDETFNYPVATIALESSWTTSGTLTTGTGRNLVSPALTYSNGGGIYALSGLGKTMNADMTSTSNYVSYKPFSATPLSSGVVYLSFLYKAGVIQSQTGVEIFGMASGTSQGPRIWVGKTLNSGFWKFGITRSSTTTADVSWNTTEFNNVNEVVLLVIKYDFGTSTASFYINPTINGTEPASPAASESAIGTARTSLNNLWFRSQGSSMFKYNVGCARVSTTWAEAVATQSNAPKLPTPTLTSATSITVDGFTANWNPVANAISYDVTVYQGTTFISKQNVATTTATFSGLIHGTTYNYKITAKGNMIDFLDSDPSAASTDITTLGFAMPVVGVATFITAQGFTANWTAIPASSGYTIQVLQGSSILNTFNVPDPATASLVITGLNMGTTYGYNIIAKGDGTTTFDSSPSATTECTTNSVAVTSINTDFGNASWGPAAATTLFGSYGSRFINGFNLGNATLYARIITGLKGETHTNAIAVDKNSNLGILTFPELTAPIAQIEIHAASGSDTKSFIVKSYNSVTAAWDLIGTYNTMQAEGIYMIPITGSATKFRIENNTTSGLFVYQIITRTTNPSLLATPIVGAGDNITATGFTANWTPVANATGYSVKVFNGITLVNSYPVIGQSTQSLIISDLSAGTTYTYSVGAIGDGDNLFTDSYLSAASALVSTTVTNVETPNTGFTMWAANKEIHCTENGLIQVYNLQGAKVLEALNTNKLNTSLASGLYIVRFTGKDGQLNTAKVLIK